MVIKGHSPSFEEGSGAIFCEIRLILLRIAILMCVYSFFFMFFLNISVGPEISEPPIDTTKIEGQTVVLSCLVAGYPTPAVAWTKNDVELNSIANLRLSVSSKNGNHTLKITDVQKSDAGQYRCVANNSLQTSESFPSTLTVQCECKSSLSPKHCITKCLIVSSALLSTNTIDKGFRKASQPLVVHC